MAWEGALTLIPGVVAAADLSSYQYYFVNEGSTGINLNTTNGARCDGVLQNKPNALGQPASVACTGGATKIKAGAAFARGALLMSDATGRAVTAASVATSATKVASAETYDTTAGGTVIIDVDSVGVATATFDAAAATIVDTTSYPVADQDTKSFTLTITGGEWDGVVQTVLFAATTTTALQVAAAINDQCVGLHAVAGAQVTVTTDGQGTDYDITFAAGTSGLTFAASTAGTGDVGDINAVTAAEFETVIEADTTALVAVSAGIPTITSPTTGTSSTLTFTGTALADFGLSAETVTGSASDSHIRGKALEAATAAGDIVTMNLAPTSKY